MENETQAASNPNSAVESQQAPVDAAATAGAEGGTQQQADPQTPPVDETSASTSGEQNTEPAEPVSAAPESYTFTLPEGTSVDPDVMDSYTAAAKQAGLSQDAAQTLIASMVPALAERTAAQVRAVQEQWATASKTDTEFGGDKLNENLAIARKAVDALGTPALRTLLDETGLGNHPEVLRLFVRAGRAISEDSIVSRGAGVKPASTYDVLYDKTPKRG